MKKLITSIAFMLAMTASAQTTVTIINESDFVFVMDAVIIMNEGYDGINTNTFTEGYVSNDYMQINPGYSLSMMNNDPDVDLSYSYPFYDQYSAMNFTSWDKHEPPLVGTPNYPGDNITGPFLSQDLQASLSTMPIQKLHAIKYLMYKDPADVGVNQWLDSKEIITQPANYQNGFTDGENYKLIFSVDSYNGSLNYFIYVVNLN